MSTKCPDCGTTMENIAGLMVCPVCDEPMNKTFNDDKWVQERKDVSTGNETGSQKACR